MFTSPVVRARMLRVLRKRFPCRATPGKLLPRRGLGRSYSAKATLAALATCLVLQVVCGAQVKAVRRVLVLNDFNEINSARIAVLDQAVFATLNQSRYQIEWYSENLDATLFADEDSRRKLREWHIGKYQNRKPDLIIVVGPASLQFMAESHQRFFPGTPVIFCGSSEDMLDKLTLDSDFTGVWGVAQPEENLKAALELQPGTKHIVVVGGVGAYDRYVEAMVRRSIHDYEAKFAVTYLTDLDMPTLLERLRQLPANTIVLLTSLMQDALGARFIDATQSNPMVVSAANAPVFVLFDVDVGRGAVGGDLISFASDGKVAGDIALRALNGAKNIPVVRNTNLRVFDWRALKRWGLEEKNLPHGSIVVNRQLSFWEMHKRYVVVGFQLLLAQTLAIVGLLWQRARRRKTEAELRRSEEKFSKSFQQSPLAISISSAKNGLYVEVNRAFEQQTRWQHEEVIGRSPLDIKLWVSRAERFSFIKQLLAEGAVRDLEIKIRRKDGQIRTTLASAELVEVNGEPCALTVFADITERKEAEEALSGVSRRLIEAHEEERTWIARELHDDINQRLALLSVTLATLKQQLSPAEVQTRKSLEGALTRMSDLGKDVQALSHRLHSSKLDFLGLVAASRSFCNDFSEQQNVKIGFYSENIPRDLPKEIALSLFRVLQEALQNANKYSGSDDFEVALTGEDGEIELTVIDSGVGFDPQAAVNGQGLGLTSMKERMKLVAGHLSIESKAHQGTTVRACVSLRPRTKSKEAAA